MISGIYSGLSGLQSFGEKQQSIADNIANVNTDGFKKTRVTMQEGIDGRVETEIDRPDSPGPVVYEQTATGYEMVEKSNVDLIEEIPQMMLNQRFFEASIKTIQTEDEMLGTILDIIG